MPASIAETVRQNIGGGGRSQITGPFHIHANDAAGGKAAGEAFGKQLDRWARVNNRRMA